MVLHSLRYKRMIFFVWKLYKTADASPLTSYNKSTGLSLSHYYFVSFPIMTRIERSGMRTARGV